MSLKDPITSEPVAQSHAPRSRRPLVGGEMDATQQQFAVRAAAARIARLETMVVALRTERGMADQAHAELLSAVRFAVEHGELRVLADRIALDDERRALAEMEDSHDLPF